MTKTERSSGERRRRSVTSQRLPQRTCVACRAVRAKRDLVRIVRSPAGTLSVDLRGKAAGRGAYLDPDPACLDRGLREGVLARALEVTIDEADGERLKVEMTDAARTRQKETV